MSENILRCAVVRALALVAALAACAIASTESIAGGEPAYGSFGPEGPRMREQFWLVPSGTPGLAQRATVFRPAETPGASSDSQRRPLVIINHGTSEATRESVAMPVFYWLSRWFVERGYTVIVPQRRGHGATGGPLVEAKGTCTDPDHYGSAVAAADDIAAVVDFMKDQPFVAPHEIVVLGISTGGWASLAVASRSLRDVAAVVNMAGGRGAYAFGRPGEICSRDRLIEAAGRLGASASTPTLWLYSKNDSFFDPSLASGMAEAWTTSGGRAELHVLPPYGDDGHFIADDHAGWRMWGRQLETFLDRNRTRDERTALQSPPANR